jgi:hypothetical protein
MPETEPFPIPGWGPAVFQVFVHEIKYISVIALYLIRFLIFINSLLKNVWL